MEHGIINLVVFVGCFLAGSVLVHRLTKKFSFPYTITVFVIGLVLQNLHSILPFPINFELETDVIFFILLPLLLFESALHIKFHQFRLQFKTISFIATFGLLLSVFAIGLLLPLTIGLPLPAAMLFGAVISATDPVAVLALFKTLKVPKRLALLVDGESMFNDGTGVIVFKLVSTFVLGGVAVSSGKILGSVGNFVYVFFGAIILGMILGYITAKLIGKISNDKIAETTLTIALALGSFVLAEHYFHVSGVITTVLAGITLGNLGIARFSYNIREFVEEIWDYIAFLSNTIVFFYIGFVFHVQPFIEKPLYFLAAVAVVLFGRALTTYVSLALTNVLPGFKDEPNVPLRWQHLVNWGGLRGTIPIILVFTIPESYEYREELVNLTLATVLFTLAINGTTASWFLKKLKLHLPTMDEEIIEHELAIFHGEKRRENLKKLEKMEFKKSLTTEIEKNLLKKEIEEKNVLLKISDPESFAKSLKRYSIAIERHRLEKLLEKNYINETAYFEFDTELDLQEDELDFEEKTNDTFSTQKSFRKRLLKAREMANNLPVLNTLFGLSPDEVILNRYQLLKARILVSEEVFKYFKKVKEIIGDKKLVGEINNIIEIHEGYVKSNRSQVIEIESKHKKAIENYQKEQIKTLI